MMNIITRGARLATIVVALVLASVFTPTKAIGDDTFRPVKTNFPPAFRFDRPNDKFSIWWADVRCRVNALRGTVSFTRFGSSAKNPTGMAVILQTERARYRGSAVRFIVSAQENNQPPFNADLAEFDPAYHVVGRAIYSAAMGPRFQFSLSWDAEGSVSAEVGGETHIVKLGSPIRLVGVQAFSGAGVFKGVAFGRVGGLTRACTDG
jgi:hypothetical protein